MYHHTACIYLRKPVSSYYILALQASSVSFARRAMPPRGAGGGGLEMGGGVLPALSKPDPVAIYLMAQKTPCTYFEVNTEFN